MKDGSVGDVLPHSGSRGRCSGGAGRGGGPRRPPPAAGPARQGPPGPLGSASDGGCGLWLITERHSGSSRPGRDGLPTLRRGGSSPPITVAPSENETLHAPSDAPEFSGIAVKHPCLASVNYN